MEKNLCIANNCRGLGEDGEPVAESRMQTLEELRGRTGWLHDEVWDHGGKYDDWDAFVKIAEDAFESDGWDAYYLWGNWTIEVSKCDNGGKCVGCPSHWVALSDEDEGRTSFGTSIGEEIEARMSYESRTGRGWTPDCEEG